jgi:hypothetical protein
MYEQCSECDRLKQKTSDAVKFETGMLAQKSLAAENGQTLLLAKMEPVMLEAVKRRIAAFDELNGHTATHNQQRRAVGSGRIMGAHGGSR